MENQKTRILRKLTKMEKDLNSKIKTLIIIRKNLVYKKDRELINVIINNFRKSIEKLKELKKIFK